jgi:hypothetical protein
MADSDVENVGFSIEEFAWWAGLRMVKKADYRVRLYVEA